jgi:hypothetical protein
MNTARRAAAETRMKEEQGSGREIMGSGMGKRLFGIASPMNGSVRGMIVRGIEPENLLPIPLPNIPLPNGFFSCHRGRRIVPERLESGGS